MPWITIGDLARLTYQDTRNIYNNMLYLQTILGGTALVDPDYNVETSLWETTGYGTYPSDILAKMNRTEGNLNKLHDAETWVNPYYLTAMAWNNYTGNKYERVKRWIDCLNLDKQVIDGVIPKPEYLMGYTNDGTGTENITDSSGNKIVCYGEEYF